MVSVLCLGDSVTYGVRDGVQPDDVFVRKLGAINAGIPGNTSGDGLVRLQSLLTQYRPSLVFIMFGLNDALNGQNGLPVASYARNLVRMNDMCCAIGAAVVLCTCNPLAGVFYGRNNELLPYVAAVRYLGSCGIAIADVFQCFAERALVIPGIGDLLVDGQHPNREGHALITMALSPFIDRGDRWSDYIRKQR